jgi:DNA-binding MarR family transcriptional regulator
MAMTIGAAPQDANPCNCTTLRKASRRISQLYDAALAPSGLKTTQRAILGALRRSGPASMGGLAAALVMDAGALAHTLKLLTRDGLVSLGVDPDDRRARLITLTDAGLAKLVETDALWAQAQLGFEAAFGGAKAEHLRAMMAMLVGDDFAASFAASLVGSATADRAGR